MSNAYGVRVRPIPDEMYFGIVLVVGSLIGLETYSKCYKTLLEIHYPTPFTLVPKGIVNFMKAFVGDDVTKAVDLVSAHGFSPYYRQFISIPMYSSFMANVLSDTGAAIRLRQGQNTTGVGIRQVLRECPACSAEQLKLHCRTTWLRSHNLPGVTVCFKHRIALRDSEIATDGAEANSKCLRFPEVEECEIDNDCWTQGKPWEKESPYLLLAQVSHELIHETMVFEDQEVWEEVYKRALRRMTKSSDKRMDWQAISDIMSHTYGDPLPKSLGIDFKCVGTRHWLKRLLGYDKKKLVPQPILHILLIGALFDSHADLEKALLYEAKHLLGEEGNCSVGNDTNIRSAPPEPNAACHGSSWRRESSRHRATVLAFIREETKPTRMELYRKHLSAYRWLQTHEKNWLDVTLPVNRMRPTSRPDLSAPRIDRSKIDGEIARAIDMARNEGKRSFDSKVKKIHLIQIAHQANVNYDKLRQLRNYPKTKAALEHYVSG